MLRKRPPVDPVLSCLSCFQRPRIGVFQVVSNSPGFYTSTQTLFLALLLRMSKIDIFKLTPREIVVIEIKS